MTLPDEVGDLMQERINTLRLLFDTVSVYETIRAVRHGTGVAVLSGADAVFVLATLEAATQTIAKIADEMDPRTGSVPIGSLKAGQLRDTLYSVVSHLHGATVHMVAATNHIRREDAK